MYTLTFSGEVKPSVHELATLLRVFSHEVMMYDVGNTRCRWFAGAMFDALKNLFRMPCKVPISIEEGNGIL